MFVQKYKYHKLLLLSVCLNINDYAVYYYSNQTWRSALETVFGNSSKTASFNHLVEELHIINKLLSNDFYKNIINTHTWRAVVAVV